MRRNMNLKKTLLCSSAAALVVVSGGCYRDFDFNADAKAEHIYIDSEGDWWHAETATKIRDGDPGDIPVPADYNGDHEWDKAVLVGYDWITGTSLGTITFPAPDQLPDFFSSSYHI